MNACHVRCNLQQGARDTELPERAAASPGHLGHGLPSTVSLADFDRRGN